jgi:hypothetical protein
MWSFQTHKLASNFRHAQIFGILDTVGDEHRRRSSIAAERAVARWLEPIPTSGFM